MNNILKLLGIALSIVLILSLIVTFTVPSVKESLFGSPEEKSKKTPVKKNFVLRIDEETFKLLEKWASDEFRSVNGQIEYLLNEMLIKSGRKK